MRVRRRKVAKAVWIGLSRNSRPDIGGRDNWGIGRWDRDGMRTTEEKEKDRKPKRIEESNRHSNYRRKRGD